ncbi:MAG: MAPEG family protein [Perlucidibaca sp.]
MHSAFHLPMLALVALTLLVWVLAALRRVREISARRLPLQSLARARDVAMALEDGQVMDNFNNLLQMPVLFYAACLALAQTGNASPALLAVAWIYVLLRVVHSAIQITVNRVRHRFYAWMASGLALLVLWAGFALSLLPSF